MFGCHKGTFPAQLPTPLAMLASISLVNVSFPRICSTSFSWMFPRNAPSATSFRRSAAVAMVLQMTCIHVWSVNILWSRRVVQNSVWNQAFDTYNTKYVISWIIHDTSSPKRPVGLGHIYTKLNTVFQPIPGLTSMTPGRWGLLSC